jgi:hypothetical protein
LLGGPIEEKDKYTKIMRLVDEGVAYIMLNMIIARRELPLVTTLIIAMTSLYEKKTCKSFYNNGTVPFLVQLFKESEADIEISSNILNILGNVAI